MGRLLESLAAMDNLRLAWRAVRGNIPQKRRARAAGSDGVSITAYARRLEENLQRLHTALLRGEYRPGPVKVVRLLKRGGGFRHIAILTLDDRIAQRAALQVLQPLWEPHFHPQSFGFRPGRSVADAVGFVNEHRSPARGWVLHADVAACFPSMNHALLLKLLGQRISDTAVLRLVRQWLDAGILKGEVSPPSAPSPSGVFPQPALAATPQRMRRLLETWLEAIRPGAHPPHWDDDLAAAWPPWEDDAPPEAELRAWLQSGLWLGAAWLRPRWGQWAHALAQKARAWRPAPATLKRLGVSGAALTGIVAAGYWWRHIHQAAQANGVLQGSPLSPLLANIYLHPFDVVMARRYCYARFADDWVVCAASRQAAMQAQAFAAQALQRLHLQLQPEKTRVFPPEQGFSWLGTPVSPAVFPETPPPPWDDWS